MFNNKTNESFRKKDLHLTQLPYTLSLAQIKKSDFSSCAHAIMQIVLFRERHLFFAFLESNEEISIILDSKTLEKFPISVLRIAPKQFFGFEISGPLGDSSVGIIHSVAEPLSTAGISIYYVSSYQTDYTLIPKDDLELAMYCLSQHFTLQLNNEIPLTQPLLKKVAKDPQLEEKVKPIRKLIFYQNESLFLISIEKEEPFIFTSHILKFIFFPDKKGDRFFSYHETNGVISLVLSRSELEELRQFGSDYIRDYHNEFARLTIDDCLAVEEVGIVDSLAGPLALSGISLFYISTFNTAHVLINQDVIDKAKKALEVNYDIILK